MDVIQLIAAGLIVLGVLLAWFGIHQQRKHSARYAAASTNWVRTSATVTQSSIVDHEDSRSDGDSSTWHEGRLRYRYTANGVEHEGTKAALCAVRAFSSLPHAQKWLLAHPPGAEIDAWYDPANPSDSAPFLDKPSLVRTGATVLVGLGFAAAGIAMLVFGF
jgi:hypothetical protein